MALAAEYVELVDADGPLRQRAVALLEANMPAERRSRGRAAGRFAARDVEIRQRYQDGATLREVGVTFGISAERVRWIVGPDAVTQVMAARRAERKAAKPVPSPIQKVCAACLKEFVTIDNKRVTCSPLCSEALVVARLYLRPGAYESHRRSMGVGDVAPNRTFSPPNSKVATILRQIGRDELLRSSGPEPRLACAATNLDGTPCKRSVIKGEVCHIHRSVA